MDGTMSKILEDIKMMMKHNMTAISNMTQAPISAVFDSTSQDTSGPPQSAIGFRCVEQSSTSNAAEK
eukprot:13157004-Ditylum_brightwellii.AAC.1